MKKLVILLADGFEEIEAVTVADVLRRAGVKVELCSLEEELVRGAHDIYVKCDINIDDITEDYDGLYLPGGMPGSKNLMDNFSVQQLIREYYSDGRLISAICAAPIALNSAGILKGHKVTSFPGMREELSDASVYLEDPVVVSDNIITSRGPSTAVLIAYAILEYLGLSDTVDELKEDMLYNYLKDNTDKIE